MYLGACFNKEYFRGFEVTWEKTGGETETHVFGDCTEYVTVTEDFPISEELLYFSLAIDYNDIEGIAFRDYA